MYAGAGAVGYTRYHPDLLEKLCSGGVELEGIFGSKLHIPFFHLKKLKASDIFLPFEAAIQAYFLKQDFESPEK